MIPAMPAKRPSSRPSARKKSPAHTDASVLVLRKLRLVFNAIKGHFRDVEKKAGVAGAQVWALSVVRDQPGVGVNELAKAMDIHQSTASNLLKPLIERRMVTASRDETDRRAVRLKITARGLAVLKKAPAPVTGVLPDALSKLDAETLARLDRDLAGLIAVLNTDRRGARMPLGQPERD
jgi:DNA-binding MarR family transcriptional regulator